MAAKHDTPVRAPRGLPGTGTPAVLPATAATPAVAPAAVATLQRAAERYVGTLKAKQLGSKYTGRIEQSFAQLYAVLPASTPLSGIGHDELLNVVRHFTARPRSRVTGKPISVVTVRTLFQHVKALLEDVDGNGWNGPRRWQKLFKIRWAGLLTPAEQRKQAGGQDTFTDDELATLIRTAPERTIPVAPFHRGGS